MKKLSFVLPVSLFLVIIVLSVMSSGLLFPQYTKEFNFMNSLVKGVILGTLFTAFLYEKELRKEKKSNKLLKIDVAALESEIRTRNREDKAIASDVADLRTALTRMLDKHDDLKQKYTSEKKTNKKLIDHLRKSRRKVRLLNPKVTGNFVVNPSGHVEKRLIQEKLAS